MLGPLLFLLLSWSLYRQIVRQPDLPYRWQQIKESFSHPTWLLVIVLMFFNWGLESQKWKWLTEPLEPLKWGKAIRAVLAGCSVTMLTPNRTGEFGGRMLFLDPENRIKGIAATIYGSMTQLLVTIVGGTIGWLFLIQRPNYGQHFEMILGNEKMVVALVVAIAIVTAFLFLLLFKSSILVSWLRSISWMKKWISYVHIWELYSGKDLLRLLTASALRYIIFILQYMLLLAMMDVKLDATAAMASISFFYLLMAMLPTIGFTELPVRGTLSGWVLGWFSDNALGIQVAGLSIWLVNLVIPAIVGSLFIMNVKLMKEENELA